MATRKPSLWLDTSPPVHFPVPHGDISVDVLVIGGGITGVTTAYRLRRAGMTVALVDQGRIGGGETGHTTAHVTFVTDTRLSELVSRHGRPLARAFWEAARLGMRGIESHIGEEGIDCDLREVPGFLTAAFGKKPESEVPALQKEAALAEELGFGAAFLPADPVFHRPAVCFPNQRKFHPLRYLEGLVSTIPGQGSHVLEETSGSRLDEEKHVLVIEGGRIRYGQIVIATHAPARGERSHLAASLFQTKLALYSTYVIEARVPETPEALYWDTNDPYYYHRFDRTPDGSTLILGGQDHKTGQLTNTEEPFQKLEALLNEQFPSAPVRRRWSGQVVETPDGIPYIGQVSERTFVGTGYSGTGMTLGTFAGILLSDLILRRKNPYAELFDPNRKAFVGAGEYLSENVDFPLHFVKDRLTAPSKPEQIAAGGGAVVQYKGSRCAMHRTLDGQLHAVSAVCPHMGCIVQWNAAEESWDCPCHGSRFAADGRLLTGPAESDLERVDIRGMP